MKIAFIGLGAMGYPMARHLTKEHDVTVWNRTTAVAEKHAAENGTRLAKSLDECAAADVIITILPTSKEVDLIVDQLFPKLRKGQLWIDCTSGDPATSSATGRRLAAAGIEYVDAPVTGGTPGADAGTLTVMIGATDDGFRRAEEICRAFGKKIVHVGGLGNGNAIKAMNNTMLAANLWVASECLMSLKKMGFDMKVAMEVLNAGSGRSNASENLLPRRIVGGEWPLTFKLSLLDKDVRIAAATTHEQHIATPMLAMTSQLLTAALRELGDQSDYIEIAKYIASMNQDSW